MSITGIGSSLNSYSIGQMMSRMKTRDPSELAASSEVEDKPNLSELFSELDNDNSGILTSEEGQQSFLDKLSEMTGMSDDLEAFLSTYDTDGDEGLSEDEVIAALDANRPQGPPPPPGGMGRPDETDMVDAADADGNGIIDEEEAEALVDIINNATGSTLTAADLISEYAEDSSSGLTTTEAVAAMTAYRPDGSSSSSAAGTSFEQEFVGALDTDEEGYLTSESIDSIVSFINEATGSELTTEEFLENYATDTDGDGDIDSNDGITVDGAVTGMAAYRPEGPSRDDMSMTAMAIGTYKNMSLMGSQNIGDIFSMMMGAPQESINRMI